MCGSFGYSNELAIFVGKVIAQMNSQRRSVTSVNSAVAGGTNQIRQRPRKRWGIKLAYSAQEKLEEKRALEGNSATTRGDSHMAHWGAAACTTERGGMERGDAALIRSQTPAFGSKQDIERKINRTKKGNSGTPVTSGWRVCDDRGDDVQEFAHGQPLHGIGDFIALGFGNSALNFEVGPAVPNCSVHQSVAQSRTLDLPWWFRRSGPCFESARACVPIATMNWVGPVVRHMDASAERCSYDNDVTKLTKIQQNSDSQRSTCCCEVHMQVSSNGRLVNVRSQNTFQCEGIRELMANNYVSYQGVSILKIPYTGSEKWIKTLGDPPTH
ncbi:hypothetical protein C8R45DRAFT_944343 [Mycena sanguinolenta]|nr:hypothetical protein C8R45DRAFT_944343 [Mycena sanguinolenta]